MYRLQSKILCDKSLAQWPGVLQKSLRDLYQEKQEGQAAHANMAVSGLQEKSHMRSMWL